MIILEPALIEDFVVTLFSQLFPSYKVLINSINHYDHLAHHISLSNSTINPTSRISKNKRFRPHWMWEEECYDSFNKLWILDSSLSADSIRTNLGSILDHLMEWSKKKYGN